MNINTTEFERILFLFSLESPVYYENIKPGFFQSDELDLLTRLCKEFYSKYKETPSKNQIELILKTNNIDSVSDAYLNAIFETPLKNYDLKWVESTAQSWVLWKNLDKSITDTVEYLQTTKVTPDNVSVIIEKVKDLIVKRNSINFDGDIGSDFFDGKNHTRIAEDLITSNWNFVNVTNGGYSKGTLNIYVGEPNVGKSIFLCNDAANYVKHGKNVLYITLEMHPQKVNKRIGSNLFNIPMNDYDRLSKDPEFIKKKIHTFKNQSLFDVGKLIVKQYPTSCASAEDIEIYVNKISESTGIKFDVVLVDYVNILKDRKNPNTENTYLKIKNICEDLRAMAQRLNVVLITATQLNRGAFSASDVEIKDIAESAGLAATADVILAIIQTPEFRSNNEYYLKLIKNRDGEKGSKCLINIDYTHLRLYETNSVINE